MVAKTIVMRMHRDEAGRCWADSADVPGYVALGADFTAVMDLVREGVDLGVIQEAVGGEIDIRWQWCDDSLRIVKAYRIGREPQRVAGKPCACGIEEEDA